MLNLNNSTFEENIETINRIIKIHVSKWTLKGIPSVDRQDISQILLLHIHQKWSLYNPEFPVGNWLSRVVANQLKNLFRNFYYKFSSPCLNCPASLGDGQCRIFGEVSNKCGLYKHWQTIKKSQHDISLPLSSEFHTNEINSKPQDSFDVEKTIKELLPKLQEKLTPNEFHLFKQIHLENKSDLDALAGLKFVNKTAGLAALKNFKQTILGKVKQIISEEEIF